MNFAFCKRGRCVTLKQTVIIAAHKPYWTPEDEAYLPLLVGAASQETSALVWQRDDEGENISAKNPAFCELTGHYWLWKNVEADIYGLCHYRRYFGHRGFGDRRRRILSGTELEARIEGYDLIVPPKRHYWIETNFSQYAHAHHKRDLLLTRQILGQQHPEYLPDWDAVMNRRSGHRFNMFIMRREPFEAYSEWLFGILFELEKRLDTSDYTCRDKRVFGYVAERLLDVWLRHQSLRIRECPVVYLESQHWLRKSAMFLSRKLRMARH